MKSQLFIPKKLKVGYQKRDDTYTKRLAYVIYYDNKNVLRKEKSWRGWITPQLGTPDVDNVPTEGFVLNREVGGVSRYSHSWDQRMEKVRVFDPRGHEFEIGIPNLLYILQECSSFKGKGLEGEFIYAWDGPELVLLPTISKEYKECSAFTAIQGNKVTSKEMIEGHSYMDKRQDTLVYMGKHNWTTSKYKKDNNSYKLLVTTTPKHIFWHENHKQFLAESGFTKIASKVGDLVSDYATRMDKLQEDPHISIPDRLELKDKKFTEKTYNKDDWYRNVDGYGYEATGDGFTSYNFASETNYDYRTGKHSFKGYRKSPSQKVTIKDGVITTEHTSTGHDGKVVGDINEVNNLGLKELYVVMKNGKKIKFSNYSIH